MLSILPLSLICSAIGLIPTIISIIVGKKSEDNDHVKKAIIIGSIMFFIEFLYMALVLYASCIAYTVLSVLTWSWPAYILHIIIVRIAFYDCYLHPIEVITQIVLPVLSLIMLFILIFQPAQNLLYVHDMKNVDIAYSISSDEILAKVDISIQNGGKNEYRGGDKYAITEGEMRHVSGKDLAVYRIYDNGSAEDHSDYIPGYIIKESDKNPEIISKRIYYDPSYLNNRDALRTVRRAYPTTCIIGEPKFDINDQWDPYLVYQYRENFLFCSDNESYGVILLNMQNGNVEKYAGNSALPSWVDFKTTAPR